MVQLHHVLMSAEGSYGDFDASLNLSLIIVLKALGLLLAYWVNRHLVESR